MKTLTFLATILCASVAFGQTIPNVPTPAALFTSLTGLAGSWTPMLVSGGTTISNVPQMTFGAYCSTDGTGNAGTWAPCQQPSQTTGLRVASGNCSGTATSSATTLSIQNLGTGSSLCTGTIGFGSGVIMASSGTLSHLMVRCANTGISASSGVFTVMDVASGSSTETPTGLTATYGTTAAKTTVADTTHTFNYSAGDLINVQFTTQASETLGNCSVSFSY